VNQSKHLFKIEGLVPGTVERITELHAMYYTRHHGMNDEFEWDVCEENRRGSV